MIKNCLKYDPIYKQWTTIYPWILDANCLPNHFTSAFGQLKALEKRLKNKSEDQMELYCEQINDMLKRNVNVNVS